MRNKAMDAPANEDAGLRCANPTVGRLARQLPLASSLDVVRTPNRMSDGTHGYAQHLWISANSVDGTKYTD